MTDTLPEFLISEVVWNEDNLLPGKYAVLIGRCGDRPIARGDVFHRVFRYQRDPYPQGMANEPVRAEQLDVELKVVEIQTHNRSLERMGEGMTGALFVQGRGLERLGGGWVLGEPESTTMTTTPAIVRNRNRRITGPPRSSKPSTS